MPRLCRNLDVRRFDLIYRYIKILIKLRNFSYGWREY
jgi:hypothetical protein